MDYFLNEYSLRGQYKDVDEFFETLREYTFPVLKKIEKENDNVIWKKDTFWQSEICNGITLTQIPKKKNERSGERALLQIQLIKLFSEDPFWENRYASDFEILEYNFDEEYKEHFEVPNCFSKAIESEGRVVSFVHPNYNIVQLPIVVKRNDSNEEYSVDNIYEKTWWKNEPEIKHWNISNKYVIEVRAKEFEYHPPHFHAISNEFAAVFKLSNCELYRHSRKKWSSQMISEIQAWYKIHKDELQYAWKVLHES